MRIVSGNVILAKVAVEGALNLPRATACALAIRNQIARKIPRIDPLVNAFAGRLGRNQRAQLSARRHFAAAKEGLLAIGADFLCVTGGSIRREAPEGRPGSGMK